MKPVAILIQSLPVSSLMPACTSRLLAQKLVVNGEMSLQPGSTTIPGWTVVSGETIWGSDGNIFGPNTPYGS